MSIYNIGDHIVFITTSQLSLHTKFQSPQYGEIQQDYPDINEYDICIIPQNDIIRATHKHIRLCTEEEEKTFDIVLASIFTNHLDSSAMSEAQMIPDNVFVAFHERAAYVGSVTEMDGPWRVFQIHGGRLVRIDRSNLLYKWSKKKGEYVQPSNTYDHNEALLFAETTIVCEDDTPNECECSFESEGLSAEMSRSQISTSLCDDLEQSDQGEKFAADITRNSFGESGLPARSTVNTSADSSTATKRALGFLDTTPVFSTGSALPSPIDIQPFGGSFVGAKTPSPLTRIKSEVKVEESSRSTTQDKTAIHPSADQAQLSQPIDWCEIALAIQVHPQYGNYICTPFRKMGKGYKVRYHWRKGVRGKQKEETVPLDQLIPYDPSCTPADEDNVLNEELVQRKRAEYLKKSSKRKKPTTPAKRLTAPAKQTSPRHTPLKKDTDFVPPAEQAVDDASFARPAKKSMRQTPRKKQMARKHSRKATAETVDIHDPYLLTHVAIMCCDEDSKITYHAVYVQERNMDGLYKIKFYSTTGQNSSAHVPREALIPFSSRIPLVTPLKTFDTLFAQVKQTQFIGAWDESLYTDVFDAHPAEKAKVEAELQLIARRDAVALKEERMDTSVEDEAVSEETSEMSDKDSEFIASQNSSSDDAMEIDTDVSREAPAEAHSSKMEVDSITQSATEVSERSQSDNSAHSEINSTPAAPLEDVEMTSAEDAPIASPKPSDATSTTEQKAIPEQPARTSSQSITTPQPSKKAKSKKRKLDPILVTSPLDSLSDVDNDPFMQTRAAIMECDDGTHAAYIVDRRVSVKKGVRKIKYKVGWFKYSKTWRPKWFEADLVLPFSRNVKLANPLKNLNALYEEYNDEERMGKWTPASCEKVYNKYFGKNSSPTPLETTEQDEFSFETAEKQTNKAVRRKKKGGKIAKKVQRPKKSKRTAEDPVASTPTPADPYLATHVAMVNVEHFGIYAVFVQKMEGEHYKIRYYGSTESDLVERDTIFPFTADLPMKKLPESFDAFFKSFKAYHLVGSLTMEAYEQTFAVHHEELMKREQQRYTAGCTGDYMPPQWGAAEAKDDSSVEMQDIAIEKPRKVGRKRKVMTDVSHSTTNEENRAARDIPEANANRIREQMKNEAILKNMTPVSNKRKRVEEDFEPTSMYSPAAVFKQHLAKLAMPQRKRQKLSSLRV